MSIWPEEADENTNNLIKDLSRKHLGITLTDSDLDWTHHEGPKNDEGGPWAIIAKILLLRYAGYDTQEIKSTQEIV